MDRITFFTIITALPLLLLSGVYATLTAYDIHQLNASIESVRAENQELAEETKKLRIEESMLVTDALADREMREHLEMVVPESNAVVYIIETPQTELQIVENRSYHEETAANN